MAELKTKPTSVSVDAFLKRIADERQRADAFSLLDMMQKATGAKPRMWGPAIVGFGDVPLKYARGRELDWFVCGFSPRKAALSLYLTCDIAQYADLLKQLGKHKVGKGCLYIKRLDDIHLPTLRKLIRQAVKQAKAGAVACGG